MRQEVNIVVPPFIGGSRMFDMDFLRQIFGDAQLPAKKTRGPLVSSYPEIQKFPGLEISRFHFGNEVISCYQGDLPFGKTPPP